MARKHVLVSDISGKEISDGKGAVVRVIFNDARRGIREFDVTDEEAQEYQEVGRSVTRRGRKPKSASTAPEGGKLAASVGGRSKS